MATSLDSIAQVIERFIRTEFQVADNDPMFTRDAHLFECGFVDSVGFVELVSFIKSTFNIEIDEGELMSEEFTTTTGISKVISSCLAKQCD